MEIPKGNRNGFGLVEVLVSIGILTIVMLGLATFTATQSREARALQETMSKLDLESTLIKTFSSSGVCTFVLADPSQSPSAVPPNRSTDDIDATSTTTLSASVISVSRIPASASPTAAIVAESGTLASANSLSLKIGGMRFFNFRANGVDQFLADFEVSFDPASMVRSLRPIVIQNLFIETSSASPLNAKVISQCSAPRGSAPKLKRFSFATPGVHTWVVPNGVTNAFVSMAGGGGSGMGWRVSNAVMAGHSGGFVASYPVDLVPGETLTITVGTGAPSYQPIVTSTLAVPGPPFYVHTNPTGDDGLGGHPGTLSKIFSPTLGTIIECAGGSGTVATAGGIDDYSGPVVAGNLPGATHGSGNPPLSAPNRPAAGPWAVAGNPGQCGAGGSVVGQGFQGSIFFKLGSTLNSGSWLGGTTPFGNGSGGLVRVSGCYVTTTIVGTCIHPLPGRDGIVHIDVLY